MKTVNKFTYKIYCAILVLKEVITIKKILFGITSLTLGGAERVLVDISISYQKNTI